MHLDPKRNSGALRRFLSPVAVESMWQGLFVFSISKGKNLHEALRYGVACGTAATLNSGTGLCKKEDVERLNEEIKNYRLFQ